MQMLLAARTRTTSPLALRFVVAPGTPLRLVAAEQPAVREDHPALEGMAQPRARRGAGTALTQDCAKRGNIGKVPCTRMSGLAI